MQQNRPQPLATEMKDNTVIFIEGKFNFIIQSLTSIYIFLKKDFGKIQSFFPEYSWKD